MLFFWLMWTDTNIEFLMKILKFILSVFYYMTNNSFFRIVLLCSFSIWDQIQCWLFKRLLIIAQWKLWHVLFINTFISISTNSFVSSCTRGRLCFLWPLTVFPAWSRISGLIVTRFDICAGRLLFVLVDYLCCLRIICVIYC